ncbi:MAG TPA: hypothetical protein VL426_06580 [Candidatus Binatia bacterium]|nr:hypothetical protein [Candidatus Binatia bacterium]
MKRPSAAVIAACAVAALLAATLLAYFLSMRPKAVPPVPPPAINKPCGPVPPCDPRLEMPCRAPTETVPCPL